MTLPQDPKKPVESSILGYNESNEIERRGGGGTPLGMVIRLWRSNDMSTVSPTSRQCTQCKETKSISEFPKDRSQTHGYKFKCKPCHAAANRDYNKRIAIQEPERLRKWQNNYYINHKDIRTADAREYARVHPDLHRAKLRNRRARDAGSKVISLTRQEWQTQREYFDYRCAYCLKILSRDEQDHIVPKSQQGDHAIENVVPVCTSCNNRKRDRSLIECLVKGFLP